MALDYNDIICQAIDTIISKRIEGLEYDKTITATIIDDSDAMNGHYIVNDGSINFDAYSEETGYVNDDNVYVTVPRGDFTQTKIIISKYTKNNDMDPIVFQSPLESMYIISDNLAAGGVLVNHSILANGRQAWTAADAQNGLTPPGRYRLVWEKDLTKDPDYVVQNNAVFDRLAVSAQFMCTLGSSYNIVQGNYGLIIELNSVLNNDTANIGQSTRLYLDSDEMFGNPYTFSSYITQQKRFDISNLNTITHIKIYLYQGDNFYYRERGSAENLRVPTPWDTDNEGNGLDIDDSRNNIFVNNLSVYLGIDTTNIDDNTFKIYSSSSSTYDMIEAQSDETYNQKVIIPVWFNKNDENGKYIGFSDGVWDYKPDEVNDTELVGTAYDEDKYLDLAGYYNRAASLPQDELVHDKQVPNVLGLLQSYADGLDIQSKLNTMSIYLDTKLPSCIVGCVQALRQYQSGDQQLSSGICREWAIGEKDTASTPPRNHQSYLDFIALLDTVKADENVEDSFMYQLLTYLQAYGDWYSNPSNTITAAQVTTQVNTLKAIVQGSGDNSFETKYNNMKNAILRFFGDYAPRSAYNIYKYTPNGLKAVVDGWRDSVLKILDDCETLRNEILDLISNEADVNSAERKLTIEWNLQQVQDHFANNHFEDYEEERQAFLRQWADKYCIYWYRYVGENVNVDDLQLKDNFMPSGWERIDNLTNNGLPKGFTINEENGHYYFDVRPTDGRVLITVGDDKLTQEKIQAILIYNHEIFKSNVLTFYNDRPVIDDMTADMTTGLYLQLTDEEKDNYGNVIKKDTYNSKETYQLYGITNRIINSSERIKRRTIRARFRGLTKTDEYLKKNCIIYWYFPINSTMLEYRRDELVAAGFSVYDPQYLRTETDADMNDFNKWVEENNADISTQANYETAWAMYTSTVLGLPYPAPGEPFIQHYKPGYAMIWRNIESMDQNGVEVLNPSTTEFFYYIKEWYVPSFTNNTIECKVVKSSKYTYEAEQYFTFTSYGTSGTDYSLCITPAGRQSAVRDDAPLHLKVEVYDTNGKVMPEETAKVSIDWYQNLGTPAAAMIYTGAAPDIYVAKLPDNTYDYAVLRAQVTIQLSYEEDTVNTAGYSTDNSGNRLLDTDGSRKSRSIDLIAYYPIAWAADDYYIEGATTVVYDSLGSNPDYYSGYYKLFHGRDSATYGDYADQTIKNGYLQVNSGYEEFYDIEYKPNNGTITTLVKESLPKLKQMMNTSQTDDLYKLYQLSMPNMYLVTDRYSTVTLGVKTGSTPTILYKQPILVIKNRYSSPMLNNWDGELTIDKKNGTILSTMMGAGIKESDNTFSGVLMGDVAQTSGAVSERGTQGLYGFNHGEQSFGFKNDGTAFIGKDGKGRIEFDGNSGQIASASYNHPATGNVPTGMMIDLDDGYIDMRGAYQTANQPNTLNNNEVNGYDNYTSYGASGSEVQVSVTSPFFRVKSPDVVYYQDVSNTSSNYKDTIITAFWNSIDYYETQTKTVNYLKQYFNIYDGDEENTFKDINGNIITTVKLHLYGSETTQEEFALSGYATVAALATAIRAASTTPGPSEFRNNLRFKFLQRKDKNIAYQLFGTNNGTKAGKELIYIGTDKYFLQTDNYQKDTVDNKFRNGQGLRFDLMKGELDAYQFNLSSADPVSGSYVQFGSDGTSNKPFLHIAYHGSNRNSGQGDNYVDLIKISNNDWLMQSQNWYDGSNIPANNSGTKFNLKTGEIKSYRFNLLAYDNASYLRLSSSGNPWFRIHYEPEGGTAINLINISKTDMYIRSPNWSSSNGTGTEFYIYKESDSSYNGKFTSYSGMLQYGDAIFSSTPYTKQTQQTGWPTSNWRLTIGNKFGVTQAGELYAQDGHFIGNITATGGSITGSLTVSGTLSGGTITGATFSSGTINGGEIIGGDIYAPTKTNPQFKVVGSTGVVTANTINVKGGTIGPFTINEADGLHYENGSDEVDLYKNKLQVNELTIRAWSSGGVSMWSSNYIAIGATHTIGLNATNINIYGTLYGTDVDDMDWSGLSADAVLNIGTNVSLNNKQLNGVYLFGGQYAYFLRVFKGTGASITAQDITSNEFITRGDGDTYYAPKTHYHSYISSVIGRSLYYDQDTKIVYYENDATGSRTQFNCVTNVS